MGGWRGGQGKAQEDPVSSEQTECRLTVSVCERLCLAGVLTVLGRWLERCDELV